ncbi:hypothetical protein BHE74_00009936 [Ensete ventricosum]|nr:hypothetical protein BHE74_00009936 [Ensete ventricosum]
MGKPEEGLEGDSRKLRVERWWGKPRIVEQSSVMVESIVGGFSSLRREKVGCPSVSKACWAVEASSSELSSIEHSGNIGSFL